MILAMRRALWVALVLLGAVLAYHALPVCEAPGPDVPLCGAEPR